MSEQHHAPVRRAIQLAHHARAHGNPPFGAVLVAPDGSIVLEAENTVATGGDVTEHAETNLVRKAARELAGVDLGDHALVSSWEPCAMCAGAIYWAKIGAVVYGLSERRLIELAGSHPDNPTLDHACRLVFAGGNRETVVTGPMLETEAAAPHQGFWADEDAPASAW